MIRRTSLVAGVAMILAGAIAPVGAASLGTKLIKGAAIGYAVKQSAGALDTFINKVTLQKGMSSGLDTKVVPILSVGEKGYIGGAQVSGPRSYVNKVQAVFQYEQNFDNGRYRIKALVPSSSLNPIKLERVQKVGVSAMIDVALSGGLSHTYYGQGVGTAQLLRAAAVAVGVKQVASPMNKLINTVTFNKGIATAVVPMASFGEKAYIGGAQISGSGNTYRSVKAVWQYEDLFSNGRYRVKILVPTNSINPLAMKRVKGVGISAVIDTSIADQGDRPREATKSNGSRTFPYSYGSNTDRYRNIPVPGKTDNGKHKGWTIGKHKGWYKNGKIKVD